MSILAAAGVAFGPTVPVVIVGGGAAGHCAALAARDAGAAALILERDAICRGSTALSSGLIPAAGTRAQRAHGVVDSPALFAADLVKKARGESDPALVRLLAAEAGPTVDWLTERHGVTLTLLDGFLYPGHSLLRMHGTPRRTGSELMAMLGEAASRTGADTLTDARVDALYADGDVVRGVRILRPDGSTETIGCGALVLACNGFGGNREMVRRFIPEMADALYFGHAGNDGSGIVWGEALGGAIRHLAAYQGHGSVATPHNILITWALMAEAGFQVNARGERFSNEHRGYSEQAVDVLAQPGGVAFDIYDARLHRIGLDFEDYRNAVAQGAVKSADTIEGLAGALGIDAAGLAGTLAETHAFQRGARADRFGRDFTAKPPLAPPFHAVKVTGAVFHTQGGLVVGDDARVRREDDTPLPNLFAAGGTACGISGSGVSGYLSGNGLLAAVTLGRIAGTAAARLAAG